MKSKRPISSLLRCCAALIALTLLSTECFATPQRARSAIRVKPKRAALVLRGPACPGPGKIALNSEADFALVPLCLSCDYDVCASRLNTALIPPIADGHVNFAQDPTATTPFFTGSIDFRNASVYVERAQAPAPQLGVGLNFYDLRGTIKNLTLENPVGVTAPSLTGKVIAERADGALLENITLKNVNTGVGLVYQANNTRFNDIKGDVNIRARSTFRASAMAWECNNCEFSNLDLALSLRAPDQAGDPRPTIPSLAGGLVAFSGGGYIRVRDSKLTGTLQLGSNRGLVIGAKYAGHATDLTGQPTPDEVTIQNVRVTEADLSQPAGHHSFGSVGTLIGFTNAPVTIDRVLARNILVESGSVAGGLIGGQGAGARITQTAVHGATIRSGNVAGGLIGWPTDVLIDNCYVRGNVAVDPSFGGDPFDTRHFAGGILGFNTGYTPIDGPAHGNSIRNSYAYGSVDTPSDGSPGGIVGGTNLQNLSVEDVYFNGDLAPVNGAGTPLSSGAMLHPASFVGFSPTVWSLVEGHLPALVAQPAYPLQSLFDFLVSYFARDGRADLNFDNEVSVTDLFLFLELYFSA